MVDTGIKFQSTIQGNMITYDKLWITMKERGVTQYSLVKDYHVSKSLLHRLRNNEGVSISTINTLCDILDCNVEDIATYHKDTPK